MSDRGDLLAAEGISKSYTKRGRVDALRGASICIRAGEAVGLIGRSGSGKSTLARIIAGLESADHGTVVFDCVSRDATRARPFSGKRTRDAWLGMQMVFQNPEASFSPFMSIGDAIREGIAYRCGSSRRAASAQVLEAMDAVCLPRSYAEKRCFELSGGECQRAAIARAIIGKPKLIICDEPTSSLDVTVQARIMDLLRSLHADTGTAFLFITHDLDLMSMFCTRAYRLHDGSVTDILVEA